MHTVMWTFKVPASTSKAQLIDGSSPVSSISSIR